MTGVRREAGQQAAQYAAAKRRQQQQGPQRVGEEARGQQQHRRHRQRRALDHLRHRKPVRSQLLARPRQCLETLPAQDHAADHGGADDQPDGRPCSDDAPDFEENKDLADGNRQQEQEKGHKGGVLRACACAALYLS